MSERKSPLKISPEKRKWARVEGLEDDSGSSPHKKSSSAASTSGSQPPGRSSPEPNCPICLGRIESKAFAHGCFHIFCRTCLVEWSKVKPECPVCRQQFSRIIFNVKSMSDFEEHIVPTRIPNPIMDRTQSFHFWALHNLGPSSGSASASLQRLMTMDEVYRVPNITPFIHPVPHISSTASSTAAGPSSLSYRITISPRQQMWPEGVVGNGTSGHLRLTATHRGTHLSVTPSTSNDYQPFPPVPGTSAFRCYVYDYNLWAKSDSSSRTSRNSSAKFYRDNPALTHRLIAFINRELNAILDSSQALLPDIITSLTQYDLRSRKFRRIVEPHLVRRTDQFIHEIYSFAISACHDMLDYDNRVVYVRKEQAKIFTTDPPVPPLGFSYEVESSDSEEERPPSIKSNNSSVIEILDSDDEVQEDGPVTNVITEVVTEATVPIGDSELHINIIDDFNNPRPGPSGLNLRNVEVVARPGRCSDSESDLDVGKEAVVKNSHWEDSDSGDSVKIIGSKKALRERTPVLVNLSDSDSEEIPRTLNRRSRKKRKDMSTKINGPAYRDNGELEEINRKKSNQDREKTPSKLKQSEVSTTLKSVIGNVIINGQRRSLDDQKSNSSESKSCLESVVESTSDTEREGSCSVVSPTCEPTRLNDD